MNVTTPINTSAECRQVSEVLSRVGDEWTMQVIVTLRDQSRRFNDDGARTVAGRAGKAVGGLGTPTPPGHP